MPEETSSLGPQPGAGSRQPGRLAQSRPAFGIRRLAADAVRVDKAVYAAIAATPTPTLDGAMRRLSRAANYSRLSLASSTLLAAVGGQRGRRAAATGLASVAATSLVVNLVIKPLGRRRRPARDATGVPARRQVTMPGSRSFPSGHTAAAVAFATGVGSVAPLAGLPLHVLAALVGYSRVHTGVHYPGDVVAGALIGSIIADVTAPALPGLASLVGVDAVAERGSQPRGA